MTITLVALALCSLITSCGYMRISVMPAGIEPIHYAAFSGDLAKLNSLLKGNRALVNSKDNDGDTPLNCAVLGNKNAAAALLLANGAEVNAKNDDGETPLHLAVDEHANDVAQLLRQHGAHE